MIKFDKKSAQKLLESVFGCSEFRKPQLEVIESVVRGNNTLCLMPTGSGKSLCYQLAGTLLKKTTIVLSPLRALAAQQASILRNEYGMEVLEIDAGVPVKDQFRSLRKILTAPPRFIFFSVERAANDGYLEHVLREIRKMIGLVVIDEAHCISQWGHNFRPAYKSVPDFLDRIFLQDTRPPVLCLTATLNPRDKDEICADFKIDKSCVFESASLYRTNLHLTCEVFDDEPAKISKLDEILRSYVGQKVLVYVHRKKGKYGTSALNDFFQSRGFNCGYFDADLDTNDRTRVMEQFKSGEVDIVFATGAFGMGIHIPDIRAVVHYLIPESVEQYYQEAGRAGRDGKPAYCHLLFTNTNIRVRRDLITGGFPKEKELRSFFDGSLIFKDDRICDLDPLRSLNDENLLSFYLLQKAGVVTVVCRGIARIKDFSETKTTPQAIRNYLNASNTGLIRTVSRKTNTVIAELMRVIFDAYSRSDLELKASPTKTLYIYKNRPFEESDLDAILADIQDKKDSRLKGLDTLISVITSADSMDSGVRNHLNI